MILVGDVHGFVLVMPTCVCDTPGGLQCDVSNLYTLFPKAHSSYVKLDVPLNQFITKLVSSIHPDDSLHYRSGMDFVQHGGLDLVSLLRCQDITVSWCFSQYPSRFQWDSGQVIWMAILITLLLRHSVSV